MTDPRQPLPTTLPRPAGAPQQPPHAQRQHAQPQHVPPQQAQPQYAQPSHAQPQQPQVAGVARPAMRPPVTQQQQVHMHHAINPAGPAKIAGMPTLQPPPASSADDGAIELVEDDSETAAIVHKKIKAFGPETAVRNQSWTRQPVQTGKGAVRVKSFHAKFSDQGVEHLDESINQFIDTHPEVDIKFVTTNVGLYDGKIKDVFLVVNVWY